MNDGPVRQRIFRTVSGVLGVPLAAVDDATDQESVETWDSLAHIHLIGALEAEFGVSFTPEQSLEMTSVPSIRRALQEAGVVDG